MADYIDNSIDKSVKRSGMLNSESIKAKSRGVVMPTKAVISGRRYTDKSSSSYAGIGSYLPNETFNEIISGGNPYPPVDPINISKGIEGAKNIKNNAVQQNITNAKKILGLKDNEAYLMFGLDTEWLGTLGSPDMPQHTYEVGLVPMLVTKDGVQVLSADPRDIASGAKLQPGQLDPLHVMIRADSPDALSRYQEAFNKLVKGNPLTADEQRTLVDLANIGNAKNIDANGMLRRNAGSMIIPNQDLSSPEMIERVKRGLDVMIDPGKSVTVSRHEANLKILGYEENILSALRGQGYNIKGTMFAGHNAYHADIQAMGTLFGKHSDLYKRIEADTIDTYALAKTVHDHMFQMYEGVDGRVSGPGRQESMARVFADVFNLDNTSHIAVEDAYIGSHNVKGMFQNEKIVAAINNIKIAESVYKQGDVLYSTKSLNRIPGSLDTIYEMGDDGWKARTYSGVSVQKRAAHEFVKEFQYDINGKTQYGVVLKNIDDNVYSVISRENKWDLQDVMQDVFQSKPINKKLRAQGLQDSARREYEAMFSEGGLRRFERYVSATRSVVDAGGEATGELLQSFNFTEPQMRNFKMMLPRLKEELPFLEGFKTDVLDTMRKDSDKEVALKMFYEDMEKVVYGGKRNRRDKFLISDLTSRGRLRGNIAGMDPSDISSLVEERKPSNLTGKIMNPWTRDYSTVNLNSVAALQKSINDLAQGELRSNKGIAIDGLENLKDIVLGLTGDGVIEESKAKKLMKIMYNVKFDQGLGKAGRMGLYDVAGAIASEIHGDVIKWNSQEELINKVESVQILKGIKIAKKDAKRAVLESRYGTIKNAAEGYYATIKGASVRDNSVLELFGKIDDSIQNHVGTYAKGNMRNTIGPKRMIEHINEITKKYHKEGAIVEFALNGDSTGLMMYISDSARPIGSKKSIAIEIPLLDPETGLIKFQGAMNANPIRLSWANGYKSGNINNRVRVDTYANKAFDSINRKGTIDKTVRMLKEGNYKDAEAYLKSVFKGSLSSIPSGAYNTSELQDMSVVNKSKAASVARSAYVDYNDLVYGTYGVSLNNMDMKDRKLLFRQLFYSDSMYGKAYGRGTTEGASIRNAIHDVFGNNISIASIKSERADQGFFSAIDAREFGIAGSYSDLSRENPRQRLNYIPMNDTDIVSVDSGGRPITRREMLSKLDPIERNRMMNMRVASESMDAIKETKGVTLRTMFANDFELRNIVNESLSGAGESYDNIHFMKRPTVHGDTILMRASAAEQFGVMQKKMITIGDVANLDELDTAFKERFQAGEKLVLRGGSNQLLGYDINGREIRYESRFDSIVNGLGYDPKTNKTMIDLSEVNPGEAGMKIAGLQGGNKGTVRILSDGDWAKYLKGYDDVSVVANIGMKKMPGDIIGGQIEYLVDHMTTVGNATTDEIQGAVQDVIRRSLRPKDGQQDAMESIINGIRVHQTISGPKVTMPDSWPVGMSISSLISAVSDKGVNNVRGGHLIGNVTFGRMDVNDVYNITPSNASADGVLVSFRDVELMGTRRFYGGEELRLDHLTGRLKELAMSNKDQNIGDARRLFDVIRFAAGDEKGADQYSIVRTKGLQDKRSIDKYFSSLSMIPRVSDYTPQNMTGTIFDKGTMGDGFFLELPQELKIGKYSTDKLFMPVMNMVETSDGTYLNEVQKVQRQIFEEMSTYTGTFSASSGEFSAQDLVNIRNSSIERLYGKADSEGLRSGGLLERYVKVVGEQAVGAHGFVSDNVFSARVGAGGKVKFAAISPDDVHSNVISEKLEENTVVMARKDLAKMLKGTDGAKDIMALAETEGIVGLGTRYPQMQPGSTQAVKYKVLSRELEDQMLKEGYDFSGKAYVTVGTQMRWGADFDGDLFAALFPQFAGKKSKYLSQEYQNIQEDLNNLYRAEVEWSTKVGNAKYGDQDTLGILDGIIKKARDGLDVTNPMSSQADEILRAIEVESRFMKEVGQLSNINSAYRRVAETVGTLAKDDTLHPVISFFGGSVEQLPISMKRLSEQILGILGDSNLNEDSILQAEGILSNFISSYNTFIDAASNMDVQRVMESSRGLGMFEGNKFIGSVKGEHVQANAMRGGDELLFEDIESALYKLQSYGIGSEELKSPWISFGLGSSGTTEKSMERIMDYMNSGSKKAFMGYGMSGEVYSALRGEEAANVAMETTASNLDGMANSFTRSRSTFGGFSSDMADTAAGDTMRKFLGGFAPNLDNIGQKLGVGAGIAIGSMWAVGRVFGGISQAPGRHDTAPSSDMDYIDPSIYAGAPEGAGPTARLSERGTGYERMNISISGNAMSGMSNEEVAQLVSSEIQKQAGMQMNINVTSRDDRTSIDRTWLQQQFASAINNGYSY